MGNTPVGTGKNPTFRAVTGLPEKHPRGDGEEVSSYLPHSGQVETPPWGRGRSVPVHFEPRHFGNTPVGTGKKDFFKRLRSRLKKHPRGDGEEAAPPPPAERIGETPPWGRGRTKDGSVFFTFRSETPPWGRGRSHPRGRCNLRAGNTPVGTGKNTVPMAMILSDKKHPRGDGEESADIYPARYRLETPPWGRGRKILSLMVFFIIRNTPVGTGKNAIFCMWYSLI